MNRNQSRTYYASYARWLVQQERISRRLVRVALREMANNVVVQLNRSNPEVLALMLPYAVPDSAFTVLLERIYTQVGGSAAEREYTRLVPQKSAVLAGVATKDRELTPSPTRGNLTLGLFPESWRQKMIALARSSETASRITGMAERTRQYVRDVLTQSASENWDIRKLTRKLRSAVTSTSRASLIARTETTRAANAGHEAGAESSGLKLVKQWIATRDTRTRDSHRAMNGKRVAKGEKFNVGGRLMAYPGDPAGGAANVCNCRCVAVHVPAINPFGV
jgi:SPP1 gp7 family putative phage head morphogenesis protein